MSDGWVRHVFYAGWDLAHRATMRGEHERAAEYARQGDNCALCGQSAEGCARRNETREPAVLVNSPQFQSGHP